MSNTQQEFLATATEQGAKNLFAALLALPEEKRNWSPSGGRTALNLVAECALNNEYTADLIENRAWDAPGLDEYLAIQRETAARSLDDLQKLLEGNTERVSAVIRTVPDDALEVALETPFGIMTIAQSIVYPYWNMSYHEGQINYIASMLNGG